MIESLGVHICWWEYVWRGLVLESNVLKSLTLMYRNTHVCGVHTLGL